MHLIDCEENQKLLLDKQKKTIIKTMMSKITGENLPIKLMSAVGY